MNQVLDALNAACGWECVVKSYDGWRLVITSGTSAEYAAPVATFAGVSYVSLTFEFSHPKFRLANRTEREQVGTQFPLNPKTQRSLSKPKLSRHSNGRPSFWSHLLLSLKVL